MARQATAGVLSIVVLYVNATAVFLFLYMRFCRGHW